MDNGQIFITVLLVLFIIVLTLDVFYQRLTKTKLMRSEAEELKQYVKAIESNFKDLLHRHNNLKASVEGKFEIIQSTFNTLSDVIEEAEFIKEIDIYLSNLTNTPKANIIETLMFKYKISESKTTAMVNEYIKGNNLVYNRSTKFYEKK